MRVEIDVGGKCMNRNLLFPSRFTLDGNLGIEHSIDDIVHSLCCIVHSLFNIVHREHSVENECEITSGRNDSKKNWATIIIIQEEESPDSVVILIIDGYRRCYH